MDDRQNSSERVQIITLKPTLSEIKISAESREQLGGKATGLLAAREAIAGMQTGKFSGIHINIPQMTVVTTAVFDAFMTRNQLIELPFDSLSDSRIAHAFQNAEMPFEVLGALRSLIEKVNTPQAVRSSGLLEDITHMPFAGVYQTKMIPNHQVEQDVRFRKLVEAIKFVWASTFYKISRDYCKVIGRSVLEEKMAVIIQRVVGKRWYDRFYPELSGVARSYNYYPVKPAKPTDRVVDLAFGMGKTVVDGGKSWTYSPAYPNVPPPFESTEELLRETQTRFWAINMGEPAEYDPTKETEFMLYKNLLDAEKDGSLNRVASTYNPHTGRLSIGTGLKGPRALTFAPLLSLNELPFNRLVKTLLEKCEAAFHVPVEIEFAMTFNPHHFGLLQVRPMVIPDGDVQISQEDLNHRNVLAASEFVVGHGRNQHIQDIIYVLPENFNLKFTRQIANQLEIFNNTLMAAGRPYLLIVFGRLGSFDPWLGIPVSWGQICGAQAILEATQENVKVELSQGSHYFHNIINLGVKYFSMPFTSPFRIDWKWLAQQTVESETEFIRHISLPAPLQIKVDGRSGHGIILKN